MTEKEYDQRRKEIHAANPSSAELRREIAVLIAESKWTMARAAAKEGMSKAWTGRQRLFGKFLLWAKGAENEPSTIVDELNEGTFHALWQTTGGVEAERFAEIKAILEGRNYAPASTIKEAVERVMKDGRSYFTTPLLNEVQKLLPEATIQQIRSAIVVIRRNPPEGLELRTRNYGRDASYRLLPPYDPIQALFELLDRNIKGLMILSSSVDPDFKAAFDHSLRQMRKEVDKWVADSADAAATKNERQIGKPKIFKESAS